MVGRVLTSRSSMTRGLVRARYALALRASPAPPRAREALSGVSVVLTVAVTRSGWQFCLAAVSLGRSPAARQWSSEEGPGNAAALPLPLRSAAIRRRPPNIIPCAFVTDALRLGPDDCAQADSSRLTQPHETAIHIRGNCVQKV